MKKWMAFLALALALGGCGSRETLETVADEYVVAAMAQPKQIVVELPGEAALPAMESGGDRLYLGRDLYATALREDTVDIKTADLSRSAVVIGSEGRGISDALLAMSEKTLKIPMRERCESLNAASAATVVLWEMGR